MGIVESQACPLYSKGATLENILSSCAKALGEERYQWRHDQVLRTTAETISVGVDLPKPSQRSKKAITFVEGERRTTIHSTTNVAERDSKEESHGVREASYLDTSLRSDQSWLDHLEEGV